MPNKIIDIPIDGVGDPVPLRPQNAGRSKIDIPLADERPGSTGQGAGNISRTELELVNRHHEEVKAQHRRALQDPFD